MILVSCDNVSKSFSIERGYMRTGAGTVTAVDGVSLSIEKGIIYGLVGESGSGKTTLGKIILGAFRPDVGRVEVNTDKVQAIFQDPYNSLDPKMKVRDILAEGLILKKAEGIAGRIDGIMELVSLPKAALEKYPHQFSGGERQRIAIARALLTEPEFIVCDEPVSSLDVTIQLQILKLLKDVQKRFNITYLFISHDLRVVRYMCGRVAVMKSGRILEEGPVADIYSHPKNPYTKKLISSILSIPRNQ